MERKAASKLKRPLGILLSVGVIGSMLAENEPDLTAWADRLETMEVRWDEIPDHVIRCGGF